MKLFTIGHTNHPIAEFIVLLKGKNITQLVDVRTSPYSKFVIEYNRETLESSLKKNKVKYFYEGKNLGGRPADPTCYRNGVLPGGETDYLHQVDYPAVMQKPWFQKGIAHLLEQAERDVTVVMCTEENPDDCHRHHLIAKYLEAEFPEWEIRHIRGDGIDYRSTSIHTSVNRLPGEQPSLF
jgi:uncharacterized protein (DUF488 family)